MKITYEKFIKIILIFVRISLPPQYHITTDLTASLPAAQFITLMIQDINFHYAIGESILYHLHSPGCATGRTISQVNVLQRQAQLHAL